MTCSCATAQPYNDTALRVEASRLAVHLDAGHFPIDFDATMYRVNAIYAFLSYGTQNPEAGSRQASGESG